MRVTFGRCITMLIAVAALAVARPSAACVGDCNRDAAVTIDELIRGVGIALGSAAVDVCQAIDNDRDGAVEVNELVRAVGRATNGCAYGPEGEVLVSLHSNELDEFDIGTGAKTLLVPARHATVNGQACLLPDGSGRFVVGEDTGQPEVRPGWGIFSPDGTFLQKLTLPPRENETRVGDPIGCAFDSSGRMFATAIGSQGGADGQLIVYFPPDYVDGCIVDETLQTPGTLTIDDQDRLYVTRSGPPGSVLRIDGPFPASAAECGSVVPTTTPFISYTDNVANLGIARAPNGHIFVSQVVGLGQPSGIREHDADGTFIREIFPPGDWGNPAGLAFDSAGSLYYADLGLSDTFPPDTVPGGATVRQITFALDGTPSEPELVAHGLNFADSVAVFPSRGAEWLTLGGSVRRTYFNPRERTINPDSALRLAVKWRFMTGGMISAQPVVTWIDLPGEGRTQIVIVSSWDRSIYAVRAENGRRVWSYQRKPQTGTFYPFAGTPAVAWIDGQQRVFAPGGESLYALDATTGAEIWQFDAGTGCTNCTPRQERNQIESSPAVVNGLVIAGMDVNDSTPGKGGVLALDARDGRLVWWFDLATSTTCRPFAEDNIRRFDGFHSEAELELPEGFLASRPGCDFDRTGNACGNVWSSPAVDLRRGLFYVGSSNCDTDSDPSTPPPPPPMPPYDEAIFAVTLEGDPAWVWRPREVDNDDLSFGAVPNLFEARIGGELREVVGIGGKDGTYYVLDRDGTNELTGRVEPYWQTNVVPGGPAGGMIGAASVGEDVIVVATAPGFDPFEPQKPIVHAFDIDTGAVLWQYGNVDSAFGPTMGVPGLAFTGGTPRPNINIFERDGGAYITGLPSTTVISGIASGPTIVGGMMFVGGGTGAFNEGSQAAGEANRDTPLSAFCVVGAPGCERNTCNDMNPCTHDYLGPDGACASEPGAEGIDCSLAGTRGTCSAGTCVVATPVPTPTPD